MYKVRFNLNRAEAYQMWKVTDMRTKTHKFYDPYKVMFLMGDCVLVNQKSTALKIHEGATKEVCAWVECETIDILDRNGLSSELISNTTTCMGLRYNPRVHPFWVDESGNKLQHGTEVEYIISDGRNLSEVL